MRLTGTAERLEEVIELDRLVGFQQMNTEHASSVSSYPVEQERPEETLPWPLQGRRQWISSEQRAKLLARTGHAHAPKIAVIQAGQGAPSLSGLPGALEPPAVAALRTKFRAFQRLVANPCARSWKAWGSSPSSCTGLESTQGLSCARRTARPAHEASRGAVARREDAGPAGKYPNRRRLFHASAHPAPVGKARSACRWSCARLDRLGFTDS